MPSPGSLNAAAYQPSSVVPPAPPREMRAVWVASVANIDWPSTNNLSTAQQKAELVAMLDCAARLKLNTVILQVRPACDALYASRLEPWSEYLTGTMGKPPQPFYDPLAFAVEEAHRRALELHAWFNPYRARHSSGRSPLSADHVSKTHPQMVRQYGKSLWLDPGEKEVQDYSLAVVMDVVKRYDIDGVHFDDYFYPYREQDSSGNDIDFPDEASWRRLGRTTGLSRDDWRRHNIDEFVQRVYQSIKEAKPWVKFGISPFGIWRPKNPPQIQGFDAYESLYADSRKWLASGWVDYFVPQLYWSIAAPEQSFPVLLKWWGEQNGRKRLLAPGLDSTKTARKWKPEEIVNQVRLTRKQAGTAGHVHWNMKALLRNSDLDAALTRQVYVQPALVPAMPWLSRTQPERPRFILSDDKASWSPGGPQEIALWLLETKRGGEWSIRFLPGSSSSRKLERPLPELIALSAVDRYGNVSRAATFQKHN